MDKSLKKKCKKLGVRLTFKRNGKRVYKSVSLLKSQCIKKVKKIKKKKVKKIKKKKKVKKRRRKFGSSLTPNNNNVDINPLFLNPQVFGRQRSVPEDSVIEFNSAIEKCQNMKQLQITTPVEILNSPPYNVIFNVVINNPIYYIENFNDGLELILKIRDTGFGASDNLPYRQFLNCTNSGMYFNFGLHNQINNNAFMYTNYHLSIHSSVQGTDGNPLQKRVHLKYSMNANNIDSNDTTGITQILANGPIDLRFDGLLVPRDSSKMTNNIKEKFDNVVGLALRCFSFFVDTMDLEF